MKIKRALQFMLVAVTIASIAGVIACNKETIQSQISSSSNSNAVAIDNLVAWYTFNGDTKDHSGNNNDVNFNSATPTVGKDGVANTAYLFDGSSYMTVPNSALINPTGAITIIAVVKVSGFYDGVCHSNRIISKGFNDFANGRYVLGFDDQPYWQYNGCDKPVKETKQSFYGSFGDTQTGAAGVTNLAIHVKKEKWYTLAYTFDGKRSKFYVNGVLQAANVKSTTFTPNTNSLFIGRNEDPAYPYYFNGVIDELRIYNVALTQNKITEANF
jgi:hypothetical protein